jgi:hypothetical protein
LEEILLSEKSQIPYCDTNQPIKHWESKHGL